MSVCRDIHDFIEVNKDGKWELAEAVFIDFSYNEPTRHMNIGRHMPIFALFGCMDSYRGILPISLPRGIPVDASAEYHKICSVWGIDGHDHSYYTLKEVIDYPYYNDVLENFMIRALIGPNFFEDLEVLKKLAPDGDFEKLRIVFFFDN